MRGQDVKRFAVAELCDHGSLSPACVHYNKPNIKQLKASLSVFEVAAVTQREPAGGRCLLEFRPRRKNPAADGRENSKDFKGKRTERIFNLWLIGLSSRGNDYLKTFWYFPHNAAEVGWGGGSQVFLQRYYVNAPLISASFSLPKGSPTLLSGKLCCHLPAGTAQSGSARLSLVGRATYESTHLGSLQKQTTRKT